MNAGSTREAWLVRAAHALIARFGIAPRGPWRVTCGWPSVRGTAFLTKRIGECWSEGCSSDSTIEIIVSLACDDPVDVLATLAHELLHAHLPDGTGHRGRFPSEARAMGLDGRPSATSAGPAFREAIAPILLELGPYPHGSLDVTRRRKQSTRLLKAACPFPECGYTLRITRKWVEVAVPRCPVHDLPMTV